MTYAIVKKHRTVINCVNIGMSVSESKREWEMMLRRKKEMGTDPLL